MYVGYVARQTNWQVKLKLRHFLKGGGVFIFKTLYFLCKAESVRIKGNFTLHTMSNKLQKILCFVLSSAFFEESTITFLLIGCIDGSFTVNYTKVTGLVQLKDPM